jgi:hypothetical protein
MNCAANFQTLMQSGSVTTEQAFELFDQLETVNEEFMLGRWQGKGFPTSHKMDGLMEHFNWYGKTFDSREHVHPLVFQRSNGDLVNLNPIWFPMGAARRSALAMSGIARILFNLSTYVLKTSKSCARLRMTEYRGKVTASMVYDQKGIIDVFRKVDDNTLLGVMDLKGERGQPFFFVLERVKP